MSSSVLPDTVNNEPIETSEERLPLIGYSDNSDAHETWGKKTILALGEWANGKTPRATCILTLLEMEEVFVGIQAF